MTNIISLVTAASFLFYGFHCLFSTKMRLEFQRFGLNTQRILTGVLQLLGAIGLIVGVAFSTVIGALAAGGLSLLMFLGFIVRLKVRDGFWLSLPSFLLMLVEGYLSYRFYLEI